MCYLCELLVEKSWSADKIFWFYKYLNILKSILNTNDFIFITSVLDYNGTKHTKHAFHTTYKGREKVPVRQWVPFSYLDFMPGLTSTTLSETWTTRMVTSPDSGWLWRFTKSFTRVSRKLPNFVCGNPVGEQCNRLLINVSRARHPLKTSVVC